MSAISDSIEKFILTLLGEDDAIELQRNELAHYFSWRALANQLCAGYPLQSGQRLCNRIQAGRRRIYKSGKSQYG